MTCAECKWWHHSPERLINAGTCTNPQVLNLMLVPPHNVPEMKYPVPSFYADFGCIFAEAKETE